jgi:dihydroneopterin aldolase
VGVLEHELQMGQWFELDFSLGCNLSAAAAADGLEQSLDYSLAIQALQLDASRVRCLTLEHWSDKIFEVLEDLYGSVPIWLELRKCQAPVPGFCGIVAVQRSRRWPS